MSAIINKNGEICNGTPQDSIHSFGELQFKREVYVLLNFLKRSDELGLEIEDTQDLRRWIHNPAKYKINPSEVWPKPEFYEIISIAQHNSLPTRALDWSYDYKVSLYFAVKNILDNDTSDCVLWAFNYKLFENNMRPRDGSSDYGRIRPFEIYRPKYNPNDNLKSQRGLFAFVNSTHYNNILADKPFDEFIVDLLKKNYHHLWGYGITGFKGFHLKENEKIFHKFIISGKLKKEILKDLHKENYSTQKLFPQFDKIVESMEEKIKFEDILNKGYPKSNILLPISYKTWNLIKDKKKNSVHITDYHNEIIDKVYLFANGNVYGYFYVNEIIRYSTEKLWEKYAHLLNVSQHEFLNRVKDYEPDFEIKINGLKQFNYEIPLSGFETEEEYCFIDEGTGLEFLLNFE